MGHELSLAPTGRAYCTRCTNLIPLRSLRLRHTYRGMTRSESNSYEHYQNYHARCALEVVPQRLQGLLRAFAPEFPDRARLEADIEAAFRKRETRLALAPSDDLVPCQDAEGRPQGRVLVCMNTREEHEKKFLWAGSSLRLASSKRSYVLVRRQFDPHDEGNDEEGPLLGGLLVMGTSNDVARTVLKQEQRRLSAWRQRGFPAPTLWIVGTKRTAQDDLEIQIREALERVGFSGDDATVLRSPSISEKSMHALVEQLDRSLPDPVFRRDSRTATRRALDTIVELVRHHRQGAVIPIIGSLLSELAPEEDLGDELEDRSVAAEHLLPRDESTLVPMRLVEDVAPAAFARERMLPEHIEALHGCLEDSAMKPIVIALLSVLS